MLKLATGVRAIENFSTCLAVTRNAVKGVDYLATRDLSLSYVSNGEGSGLSSHLTQGFAF